MKYKSIKLKRKFFLLIFNEIDDRLGTRIFPKPIDICFSLNLTQIKYLELDKIWILKPSIILPSSEKLTVKVIIPTYPQD